MLRAVLCERIAVYLDNLGSVTCDVPPIKGLLPPSVWPSRSWIEVAPPALSGMQSLSGGIATVLEDIGPPGGGSQTPGATSVETGSIAWAKSQPDGTSVSIQHEFTRDELPPNGNGNFSYDVSIVVTADTSQFDGFMYVEESVRSAGIRVVPIAFGGGVTPVVGDTVSISGTMGTILGERAIVEATVTKQGTYGPLREIGIVHRDQGGSALGSQQAVAGALGLNNIGLLVRIRGKVTAVEQNRIYIDDGSNVTDAAQHTGVMVTSAQLASGNSLLLPSHVGEHVSLIGISACTMQGGQIVRVLRPRSQADAAPLLVITGPADATTITMPSNGNAITVTGSVYGASAVNVWVDAGTKQAAQASGSAWTCGSVPISSGEHTIHAEALDAWSRVVYTTSITITVVQKTVIYVNSYGDDTDGSTWAKGKHEVTDALAIAVSGTDIWVREGTYNEQISLTTGVQMYGGFAGTESYREQRDWAENTTILYGDGDGSVVTFTNVSQAVLDGFTITNGSAVYGGGVYCENSSPTISHNIITGNAASGELDAYGSGIYCSGGSPVIANNIIRSNAANAWCCIGIGISCRSSQGITIVGNVISDHSGNGYGGGIYCADSSGSITNNTVVGNSAEWSGVVSGGICYEQLGAPMNITIANNIIAYNASGMCVYVYDAAPTLRNNCVYGNQYSGIPADYLDDLEPGEGDFSDDPGLAQDGIHLLSNSPCINAGYDSIVEVGTRDIDGEARIQGQCVDIGADEFTDPCIWYRLTTAAQPTWTEMGESATVTVTVLDPVTLNPVSGRRVDFQVTDGELVSIHNDDQGTWTPDDPPTTGYGITGANGKLRAAVTRETNGYVHVTAVVGNSCDTGETTETARIWFCDPDLVHLLFLIDATGSTGGGSQMRQGITDTVDYLSQQLQAQGRLLRVAGIKYSNYYEPNPGLNSNRAVFYDFTTDTNSFNGWVEAGGAGGELEYTLDILMCAKDMAPTACPGLYIALATDEDSDSIPSVTPATEEVAMALTQAGCIVFIDPATTSLVSYYEPLAVNGGAVEQEAGNIGWFRYENMRQRILSGQ